MNLHYFDIFINCHRVATRWQ